MMFSFSTCRFVFLVTAAWNAATSSAEQMVDLGFAEDYVILAKSGITNIADSIITGDIGVWPIAATAMTGFSLTLHPTGQYSTSSQVKAPYQCHAADYGGAVFDHLTTAVGAMEAAYTDAAGRSNPDATRTNFGEGKLGGVNGGSGDYSLTAGIYTFDTNVVIENDITFQGSAEDVFILQIAGSLTQVANTYVHLAGGVSESNIFWQVAGDVEVRSDAHMEGILLVKTKADFWTDSSLTGRVLTQTACNLAKTTVTQPDSVCLMEDNACGPGNPCTGSHEGMCCSQYGYCGMEDEHCGTCCQLDCPM